MTTDEKAKAYEMALEGARKELGVDRKEWEVVQQVLHNIFPELRESEDERIRKTIKLALIASEEELSDFYATHNITRKDCTDWLEKQKEQKPVEWSEEDDQLIGFVFDLLNDLVWRKDWAMSKEECLERLKSLRPQK